MRRIEKHSKHDGSLNVLEWINWKRIIFFKLEKGDLLMLLRKSSSNRKSSVSNLSFYISPYISPIMVAALLFIVMLLAGCGSASQSGGNSQNNAGNSQASQSQQPTQQVQLTQPTQSTPKAPVEIQVLGGKLGTKGYVIGQALADILNKNSEMFKASGVEVSGSYESLRLVQEDDNLKKKAISYTVLSPIYEQRLGKSPFSAPYDGSKILAGIGHNTTFFVTLDTKIDARLNSGHRESRMRQ